MLVEIEKALALDPLYAVGYLDRGLAYLAFGDEARAMAEWQKALSLDPSLAQVHHNIATQYYNQGDYVRALEEYTAALTIGPHIALTWNSRPEPLRNLGQNQECVENTDRAHQLQPDLWDGYFNRATCAAAVGDCAAAISDYGVYLEKVTDNRDAWYNWSLCYRLRDLGSNQQAVEDYIRTIEIDPTFAWALINRGNAYIDLKEYELGLTGYDAALDLDDVPRAYGGRGDAYLGLERYDEAVADIQHAIDLLPTYVFAYARLAAAYVDQNRYEAAIEAASMAWSLNPRVSDKGYGLQA